MKQTTLLQSVVSAARQVAAQKLDEAASGWGSKTVALLAVVTLEAAHAMLQLYPPTCDEVGDTHMGAGIVPPVDGLVEVRFGRMPEFHFTVLPERSEHGPN